MRPALYHSGTSRHHGAMRTTPQFFLCALGLCLVLEGALWALFPDGMRRVLRDVLNKSPDTLRRYGLAGVGIGLLLVALFR